MKKFLSFLIILLFACNSFGQTQLWIDDFDGSNSNPFSISNECGGDPFNDYYGVACENGAGCSIELSPAFNGAYFGFDGNFLGGYNTDDEPAGCGPVNADIEFAEWSDIDISSCVKPDRLFLCFKVATFGHLLIGNPAFPDAGWDVSTHIKFSVAIDGGPFMEVTAIEDQGNNSQPAFDLDCDGSGDTFPLTNTLTEFCVQIPGGGALLDLRIDIDGINQDAEDFIIDDVAIYCDSDENDLDGDFLGCGNACADVYPTFDPIPSQCEGGSSPLPATSLEGATGTWTPAFDPDNSDTYTFTPEDGCCLSPTDLMVTIDPRITPTFTQLGPYCEGDTPDILPTSSTNSPPILGSWDGPIDTGITGTI